MNAPLRRSPDAPANAGHRIQINTCPNDGEVDFSPLATHDNSLASLDLVSVADILRNAFVYPPHTIYQDVKIAATGFAPDDDMFAFPRFHFPYQAALNTSRPPMDAVDGEALVQTYHRLLCEAVARSTANMKSPWLLQSGGKDSTSMAIAVADARPDTTCLTYLGGREENEVASARFVARQLGLRHEALVCDPGRAYDRYLAIVPRLPLLTADFAALSYADLATEVGLHDGDGLIDALGSDQYFGVPLHAHDRVMTSLARGIQLPKSLFRWSLINRSFTLCFALATLQMVRFERFFPGSRFSDAEVDDLLGWNASEHSRQRIKTFQHDVEAAASPEAVRRITLVLSESSHLAKGMYTAKAVSLHLAYPYCDKRLRDWVFHEVPNEFLIGEGGVNKVLMREYIARHFKQLPYVKAKGSFRFDVRGLARQRFDQVHAFAVQTQALLPGAPRWLEMHRHHLHNKFFASKFYLLAMTLPWLLNRMQPAPISRNVAVAESVPP